MLIKTEVNLEMREPCCTVTICCYRSCIIFICVAYIYGNRHTNELLYEKNII